MWRVRWWLHKGTGFRGWDPPWGYIGGSLRYWMVWAWNEYDDWLYNGIHGFRLVGAEFDTYPRWLEKLSWRLLPLFRAIIRRPEQIR